MRGFDRDLIRGEHYGQPVPNAGEWLGSTPAGCEVWRGSPAENESPTLDRDLPKSALDGETIM